jgi:hypothetical protein
MTVVTPSGFLLHTNGFSFPDVYRLACMLHYVFDLVNIQNLRGKPVVYIPANQLAKFYALVQPHLLPDFAYKFRHKALGHAPCASCAAARARGGGHFVSAACTRGVPPLSQVSTRRARTERGAAS